MRRKKMRLKNKSVVTDDIIKYQIHLFESEHSVDGFEFITPEKFFKKIKKPIVTEVLLYDMLDYFGNDNRIDVLSKITTRIKSGGKIFIQGVDAKLLSSAYLYGQIDTNIFKTMLFGAGKNNIFTIDDIKNLISEVKTISVSEIKFINAMQYYIECFKNE